MALKHLASRSPPQLLPAPPPPRRTGSADASGSASFRSATKKADTAATAAPGPGAYRHEHMTSSGRRTFAPKVEGSKQGRALYGACHHRATAARPPRDRCVPTPRPSRAQPPPNSRAGAAYGGSSGALPSGLGSLGAISGLLPEGAATASRSNETRPDKRGGSAQPSRRPASSSLAIGSGKTAPTFT